MLLCDCISRLFAWLVRRVSLSALHVAAFKFKVWFCVCYATLCLARLAGFALGSSLVLAFENLFVLAALSLARLATVALGSSRGSLLLV